MEEDVEKFNAEFLLLLLRYSCNCNKNDDDDDVEVRKDVYLCLRLCKLMMNFSCSQFYILSVGMVLCSLMRL